MKVRTYLPLHYQQTRPCGAALAHYWRMRDPDRPDNDQNSLELSQLFRNVLHMLRM